MRKVLPPMNKSATVQNKTSPNEKYYETNIRGHI